VSHSVARREVDPPAFNLLLIRYSDIPRLELHRLEQAFIVRCDLAREVALGSAQKAESHRLRYEMSEDALSWNVFVSLAEMWSIW